MAKTNFRAARPLWRQGMLVRPQHMQQQDIYHEQNLDARIRSILPDAWGVEAVTFDQTALRSSNNVAIIQFRGVMPDGTCIDLSAGIRPPAHPVGEVAIGSQDQGVGVYLSVPLVQHGVDNITKDESLRRYTIVERSIFDIVDIKTKDARVDDFQVGEPTVVLSLGEPRGNHAAVKIGELARGDDGQVSFASDYIPPLLSIGGSEWLCTQLDTLVSYAITRRRALQVQLQSEAVVLRALRLADVNRMKFCTALDRAIPSLRSLVSDRRSSPRVLFHCLAQLCGELTLPCGGDASVLPIYHHQDLRASFAPLFGELKRQLEVEFGQHYVTIPLVDKGNYWAAQDSHLATCKRIFLVLNGLRAPEKEVKRLFRDKAKVASAQRLRELVQKAVSGLPLTPLERGPEDVPARRGDVFFEVDMKHRFWHEVTKDQQIGVYISVKELGPKHLSARLIGLLGEEQT